MLLTLTCLCVFWNENWEGLGNVVALQLNQINVKIKDKLTMVVVSKNISFAYYIIVETKHVVLNKCVRKK